MKKLLFVFAIIALQAIISHNNALCQWVDKGDYKEIQTGMSVDQLLVPEGENYFCTFNKDSLIFRRYDYNGKKIFERKLKDSISKGDICDNKYIDCSSDGKTYCIYSRDSLAFEGYLSAMGNILDINTDSVLFKKEFIFGFLNVPSYVLNFKIDINKPFFEYKNNLLILGGFYSLEYVAMGYYDNSYYHHVENGDLLVYNTKSGKTLADIETGIENLIYSTSNNYIIYTGGKLQESGKSQYNITSFNKEDSFNYINLNNNHYIKISGSHYDSQNPSDNYTGFIPNDLIISNKGNSFIAQKDQTIYKYTIINDSVLFDDSLSFSNFNMYSKIIYSHDDNYCIYATYDNYINIFNIPSKTLMKSITLTDGLQIDNLVLTPDGKGFLATTPNGTIKYFNTESYINVPERTENISLSSYPNPASNYINIKTSLPETSIVNLILYDVLGNKIMEKNNYTSNKAGVITIDTKSLPFGIYYFRLQAGGYDKTEKFVVVH